MCYLSLPGCDCSSEYYFTDSSDIRETTGPGWYGDVASSSDDDGTFEDEQLNIHDSIKQENFDGDFHGKEYGRVMRPWRLVKVTTRLFPPQII